MTPTTLVFDVFQPFSIFSRLPKCKGRRQFHDIFIEQAVGSDVRNMLTVKNIFI